MAFLMLLSANRITCGADGFSLTEVYQMDRIQSFLHPKESVYYQTSVEMISDAANMFKNGGEATAPEWVMDVEVNFYGFAFLNIWGIMPELSAQH